MNGIITIIQVEQWVKNEGISKADENKNITADPVKRGFLSSKKKLNDATIEFLDWLKTSLGPVRVSDVKPSGRNSEHPFMVIKIIYFK